MTTLLVRRPFRSSLALSTNYVAPQLAPAFNVVEDADGYTVSAALPGLNPADLDVSLEQQTLTVKGEIKEPALAEGARYHVREQAYGSFERSFKFRLPLNSDGVEASFEHGVLTLRLPKAEALKPRKIAVNA